MQPSTYVALSHMTITKYSVDIIFTRDETSDNCDDYLKFEGKTPVVPSLLSKFQYGPNTMRSFTDLCKSFQLLILFSRFRFLSTYIDFLKTEKSHWSPIHFEKRFRLFGYFEKQNSWKICKSWGSTQLYPNLSMW